MRCVSQRSIPRVGTATTSARERVAQRVGQQPAQRLDEPVGPFGSMDVQHPGHRISSRAVRQDLTTVDAPGTTYEGEVLIRRLRWASDETGFAVIDAEIDGDEFVLVGTLSHLEERERADIGAFVDEVASCGKTQEAAVR